MICLEQVIGYIISPLTATFIFFGAGFIFWLYYPRRKLGPALSFSGLCIFFIFSMPITGLSLLKSLEHNSDDYVISEKLTKHNISNIVIIINNDLSIANSNILDGSTLNKLSEAARICKQIPHCSLLLYLHNKSDNTYLSDRVKYILYALGISLYSRKIIFAPDTYNLQRILKSAGKTGNFALVTSAYKMRRSKYVISRLFPQSIAVPSNFYSRKISLYSFSSYVTSGKGLTLSTLAIKEYLALLFCHIRLLLDNNN